MSSIPTLLRSLLITSILSFLAPILLVAIVWAGLFLSGYLPALEGVSQVGVAQLSHFLQTFGSGSFVRGLLIIGLVCSLVGILFDTYTFYRYQKLNS